LEKNDLDQQFWQLDGNELEVQQNMCQTVSVNKISHIQIPIAILDSRSNYHILTEKFIEYYNLK
jgi:hypothetical protein